MWSLQIEGVSLRNHQQEIVSDWNALFTGGEKIGIYDGKRVTSTSILLMLGGYLKPNQGNFWLSSDKEKMRIHPKYVGVGSIRQVYEPIPFLRVEETIRLQANLFRVGRKKYRVEKIIQEWNLDKVRKSRYIDLSPLDRLRTSIAAATIHHPHILLLDQPEDGLTDEEWDAFWSTLKQVIQRDQMILALTTLRRDVWLDCQSKIDLSMEKENWI